MFKFRLNAVRLAALVLTGMVSNSLLFGVESVAKPHEKEHHAVLHIGHDQRGKQTSRHVKIGLDKSMIVELPAAVSDVLVSNPKIVDAVVHTSRRVYLIGMKVGQANVFFFDKKGNKMAILDMRVERDLKGLSKTLKRLIPNSDIALETVGDNVVMTGSVDSPSDATKATNLAKRLFEGNDKEKVLNMISVKAKEQVMLKVIVAEMNRKLAKDIGVNSIGILNNTAGFLTNPALASLGGLDSNYANGQPNPIGGFTAEDSAIDSASQNNAFNIKYGGSGSNRIAQTIRALENNGLVRTLAEPTLTALSGETAKFHAGGEFGFVLRTEDNGIITYVVEFKDYGVQLNFTPVVLSEGRISLKIKSDVSEIDGFTLNVPSLTKRETETTVELPSGGTMAISGMISEKTKENIDGLPGMMKLPILGALFRSRAFQKEETELVVLVTPYLVNPGKQAQFTTPTKGYATASDDKAMMLGHMNHVYGKGVKEPRRRQRPVRGREVVDPRSLGFIVE